MPEQKEREGIKAPGIWLNLSKTIRVWRPLTVYYSRLITHNTDLRDSSLHGVAIVCLLLASGVRGGQRYTHSPVAATKRLLLVGGAYDHLPKETHEYMSGKDIIAKRLADVEELRSRITNSEKAWIEEPGMITTANGIVLFREQGAC